MSKAQRRFVICVDNADYPASLEVRKIYEAVDDPTAAEHDQIRVIDESGEDFLYPKSCFIAIDLPQAVLEALAS